MNVGSLFVQLGIKGSEKTIGALSSVKTGLSSLADISLSAKAAIAAAIYALEQLMSSSARTGTELTNFTALTGISSKTLQQYQYAAAQVGVSNEEMTSSFKSVQNVMTSMKFGKGAPAGLAMLNEALGGDFDTNRAKDDTEYVMKKLQEYANVEKDAAKRNLVMKSFGLGEGVISGMARNGFRSEVMNKAPTYSPGEEKQLDRVNAAFTNLGNKIKMAAGHFTALHGGQLVGGITKVVDLFLKLSDAIVKGADKLKLFEKAGKILEFVAATAAHLFGGMQKLFSSMGIEKVITAILRLGEALVKLADHFKLFDKISGAFDSTVDVMSKLYGFVGNLTTEGLNSVSGAIEGYSKPATMAPSNIGQKAQPRISPLNQTQNSSTQNNSVNQTFNFQNDGRDARQIGDAAQKGINHAFRQIPQGEF